MIQLSQRLLLIHSITQAISGCKRRPVQACPCASKATREMGDPPRWEGKPSAHRRLLGRFFRLAGLPATMPAPSLERKSSMVRLTKASSAAGSPAASLLRLASAAALSGAGRGPASSSSSVVASPYHPSKPCDAAQPSAPAAAASADPSTVCLPRLPGPASSSEVPRASTSTGASGSRRPARSRTRSLLPAAAVEKDAGRK
mmetsp:Transcript_20613/g.79127  ORF Transcript_20613/g.79127 Transcript_20613/m.79127 type:complete len:201 (-) Transcript_20613:204-806(-)